MKLRYKILNGILIVIGLAIPSLALIVGHTSKCGRGPVNRRRSRYRLQEAGLHADWARGSVFT